MLVDPDRWRGHRVLVTGHTGFKGSWLCLWLHQMGAEVHGLSLPAERPSLFEQARVGELVAHHEGDIRDPDLVDAIVQKAAPQTVFHLAAQPIVRHSYVEPRETFATNVQGTVNVLDACRRVSGLEAIVAVTSDKCYENREWVYPYRETDPMGGHDPYSASKGAAEIAIASWRASFFNGAETARLASVRAGNVIGGGDWAADRLVPDIIRAMAAGEEVEIRSPNAIRPWQHVLEALGGYLLIAQGLREQREGFASAWNFGPDPADTRPVEWIVQRMVECWGQGGYRVAGSAAHHEANILKLDCAKARSQLGWQPSFSIGDTIAWIVDWHKAEADGADMRAVSLRQLEDYRSRMDRTLTEGKIS